MADERDFSIMTPEVMTKLKEAFMIGCNNDEAAMWAGISRTTLYDYLRLNLTYSDDVEQWKQNPTVKARNTVFKALENPDTAKWYLERKNKDEFGNRTELTGAGGRPLIPQKPSEEEKAETVKRIAETLAIIKGGNGTATNTDTKPPDGGTVPPSPDNPIPEGNGSGQGVAPEIPQPAEQP